MEREAFGVLYERYAMGKLFESCAKRLDIRSVVELPALGAKAMPSMYSYGFARAGCDLTLVNASDKTWPLWKKLGYEKKVHYKPCDDLENTGFEDGAFDLSWNFATIPNAADPDALLQEMCRISKKYVAIVSVNRGNVGFPCHRFAHRWSGIPWTHGDIRYNSHGFVRRFMKSHGLRIARWGFVDCPVWPDSLGFRDLRLHRLNVDLNKIDWYSDYFDYEETGVPNWMKAVYVVERLPLPSFIKTFYSHLFYVIAEKTETDAKVATDPEVSEAKERLVLS